MIKQIADTSSSELTIRITSKSKTDEIKETELLLDRLNKQMQRQIEAHSKGLIEDEDLKASTDRVKEERQLLRSKLEKLKSDKGDTDTVKKNIQDFIDDITSVDRLKAKTGIMKLIDSLVLKDNIFRLQGLSVLNIVDQCFVCIELNCSPLLPSWMP